MMERAVDFRDFLALHVARTKLLQMFSSSELHAASRAETHRLKEERPSSTLQGFSLFQRIPVAIFGLLSLTTATPLPVKQGVTSAPVAASAEV